MTEVKCPECKYPAIRKSQKHFNNNGDEIGFTNYYCKSCRSHF